MSESSQRYLLLFCFYFSVRVTPVDHLLLCTEDNGRSSGRYRGEAHHAALIAQEFTLRSPTPEPGSTILREFKFKVRNASLFFPEIIAQV